jgi:hypothetical protein
VSLDPNHNADWLFSQITKGFRVLLFLNIAQLILYIGGLALIGQGLLFVPAIPDR